MANELQHRHTDTAATLYFTLRKPNGAAPQWNGSDFEAVTAANWGSYDIAMTEGTGNYLYSGSLPAVADNMVAGWYHAEVYEQAGASPAIDDTRVATYFGYWDGTTFRFWGADALQWGGASLPSIPAAAPTAEQVRAEIDSNSTQLAAILEDTARIDAAFETVP